MMILCPICCVIARPDPDHDPDHDDWAHMRFVNRCLEERGYEPVGWE